MARYFRVTPKITRSELASHASEETKKTVLTALVEVILNVCRKSVAAPLPAWRSGRRGAGEEAVVERVAGEGVGQCSRGYGRADGKPPMRRPETEERVMSESSRWGTVCHLSIIDGIGSWSRCGGGCGRGRGGGGRGGWRIGPLEHLHIFRHGGRCSWHQELRAAPSTTFYSSPLMLQGLIMVALPSSTAVVAAVMAPASG